MSAGTVSPAKRGVRFYDADAGVWRYRPKGGGKAVDLHSPEGERVYHRDHGRPAFNARETLRRTGMRAASEGRTSARVGKNAFASFADASGASRLGVGTFLIGAGASLLALALLDTALGGRGPAAVQKILQASSSAISKLFAANDPIIGHEAPAPSTAAVGAPAGASTGGLDPWTAPKPGASSQRGFRRLQLPPDVTQGGRTVFVDSTIVEDVVSVARHFGVTVSSGYRDAAHNAEVGGAPGSDHLVGAAADFVGSPAQITALQAWAERQGYPYVEPAAQAKDHVHISFFRNSGGR